MIRMRGRTTTNEWHPLVEARNVWLQLHQHSLYRDNVTPEQYAEHDMLKQKLNEVLNDLSDRERRVIMLRYGLGEDGKTHTLEEVGKEFNVTRERIRQIEAKAIKKLRQPKRSNALKDFRNVE